MNRSARLHLSLAAAALAVSAIAGWCSVHEPDKTNAGASALVRAASPAGAPRATGPRATVATLPSLEHAFREALDPSSLTYTGERLAELCLKELTDLPGQDPATTYARRWAAKNPREMYAWFMQRGGSFSLPHSKWITIAFLATLFSEWAKRDATAAAAAALTCPNRIDAGAALTVTIAALRKSDPVRAAAMAAEHIDLLDLSQIHFDVDGGDYRETWDLLRALPAGKVRDVMLGRYFNEIAHRHSDFGQLWNDLPDDARRGMVDAGFTGRIRTGGEEVPMNLEGLEDLRREQAAASGDPHAFTAWLESRGREWAARDPAAAIVWAQEHLKGEPRVEGTAAVFRAVAAVDFDAAVSAWEALPEGVLRNRAAGNLAAGAPAARKEEVDALLATLPPGDLTAARLAQEKLQGEQLLNAEKYKRGGRVKE